MITLKHIEGDYYASDCGIIYRHTKEGCFRPLRNHLMPTGYYRVVLMVNGKRNLGYVHRLVAKAYIPNPDLLPEVDHIDTNRTNNNVSNLRWVSHVDNCSNPKSLKNYRNSNKKKAQVAFGYTPGMACTQYIPVYENNKQSLRALELNEVYRISYDFMSMWAIRTAMSRLRKEGYNFLALHFKEERYALVKKVLEPTEPCAKEI